MKKLAYIFGIALFFFGCSGMPKDIGSVFNKSQDVPKPKESEVVTLTESAKQQIKSEMPRYFPKPKFCESGIILPIDCTEADKNSREIWFKSSNYYHTDFALRRTGHPCRGMPNPDILFYFITPLPLHQYFFSIAL